jgi:ADP-ribose pyrophosphatase YjhB (NUDIX family)
MDEFGFFGPSEKHYIPGGGFCISVFAFVGKGGNVLLVRPAQHEKWGEWAPNWRIYSDESLNREFRSWRFPSSYVKSGEHPDDALSRVMKDQLGVSKFIVKDSRLVNYYAPSRRYKGEMHWDYCFVYNVEIEDSPSPKPWLDAVRYLPIDELKEEEFGSGQGSLIELVKPS